MRKEYLSNYHSHSLWCKHASGSLEDYIIEAINQHLSDFAICDHIADDENFGPRMSFKEFPSFINEVLRLKTKYKTYFNNLYSTLEVEYHSNQIALYNNLLKNDFDFLILGQHQSDDNQIDYYNMNDITNNTIQYTNDILEALDTKLFKILAHPDLILVNYASVNDLVLECMDKIFKRCQELGIYVEINANGLRNNKFYPSKEVWSLALKYPDLKIIINSDAHSINALYDSYIDKAYAFAKELGLKICTHIDI